MRPRSKRPRTKSGRLSKAYATDPRLRDLGTAEAQAKRRALVGEGADPVLAATAPGVLFAGNYLTREQYAEALEYRSLRCALYGTPWPSASLSAAISEERLIKLRRRFNRLTRLLTEEQKRIVSDVCVFDHIPAWFFAQRRGLFVLPEDAAEHELLIGGLNALLGVKQKRAA